MLATCTPAPVDLDRRDEHHVVGQRVAADQREQLLPRLLVSFFESSRAARLSSRPGPSTHAATTSGPAQAPRPTSSTPATGPRPLRYSADSRVRSPEDFTDHRARRPGGGHGLLTLLGVHRTARHPIATAATR